MKKIDILLSAVVVAHNEEFHLDECLKTLSFANELIVVLDKCTDKSKEIAKKYTKNIVEGSWDIEGERRNVAINRCKGRWILELDADERISEELKKEIIQKIHNNDNCNFSAKIDTYIGKRLVNNGWLRSLGVKEKRFIHYSGNKKYFEDRSIHPVMQLKGEVKIIKSPITHYMDRDISNLIKRFDNYTSLRAKDIIKSNKKIGKANLLMLFFSFINRFFKAFVKNKGYKEGGLGILVALLSSCYNLVSTLKVIELKEQNDSKQFSKLQK